MTSAAVSEALGPTIEGPALIGSAVPLRGPLRPPPQSWDRYRILSFVGSGGMGSVYKAQDLRLNRTVALKFLRADRLDATDPHQRRRFETEARAQARIEHPHICKIYEVGVVEDQPYIAMQFIDGVSLEQLVDELPREEKVRIIKVIAEALHAAHLQGVIHRDIKPANIMLVRAEDQTYWPYLMDFGLAREVDAGSQTSTGMVAGTPGFMSPEQARGNADVDVRSDVYGLGAALYHVLCGRAPFGGNATEVLLDVIFRDPPPMRTIDAGLPKDLDTIVLKCLEKQPARRYQSARALYEDLERYLAGASIRARPPSLPHRLAKFARRHTLLVVSVSTLLLAALCLGAVVVRARIQATRQARLAQHLGQEITKMEWLLRSARQLPLHDLEREKAIIRRRMQQLQAEITGYGALGRGLAHYALGRGHLALHEYPQALTQLQLAVAQGNQSAEVHYALGVTLGKHFERAIHEARLSGGGDWAQKQLKELEPRYLAPAIDSLSRSRAMQLDAPAYLEALISFYRREHEGVLRQTESVVRDSPWLYEALKLAGDAHHERALQARDRGHYEDAQTEFSAAVRSYEEAATIGRSDAEVYEALAETWLRQIEMQRARSRPAEAAYAAAIAASDKITAADSQSTVGLQKKASAAMLTVAMSSNDRESQQRTTQCLEWAGAVLAREPGHPYASESAANCYTSAAENARARGQDPEPLWDKALTVFSGTLQRAPRFLWGLNDLGTIYGIRGAYRALHGSAEARKDLERSISLYQAATALDERYLVGWQNTLGGLDELVSLSDTQEEEATLIPAAERAFSSCQSINRSYQPCLNNYAIFYVRLARRRMLAGEDARPYLANARATFAELERLGGNDLDTAQNRALLHFLESVDRTRRSEDTGPALDALRVALLRCFSLAENDSTCRSLAAQAEWQAAERLVQSGKSAQPALKKALGHAILATQSHEQNPDAFWALAETHLRLAAPRPGKKPLLRHVRDGLAATDRLFALNPGHVQGTRTRDALRAMAAGLQAL